ncbi:MAG: acyl carrier protein [Myxococcota bacterium]|nr:acyl carrier protein [Myxococcota bacterium]
MKEKLRTFIIDNFMFGDQDASLDDSASFLDTGIVDSTGILELVAFIEGEFKINVRDEDLIPENFDSIDRIVTYVNSRLQDQPSKNS